jgi:hypothetical protein
MPCRGGVTGAWSFGVGNRACSAWTSGSVVTVIGFVQGFWSGINVIHSSQGKVTVGDTIGANEASQVVDEVHAHCLSHPTLSIGDARGGGLARRGEARRGE